MGQVTMKYFGSFFSVLVVFYVGCSSHEVAPNKNVELVVEWLSEFPDHAEFNYHEASIDPSLSHIEFAERWLEKGKEIPNLRKGLEEVLLKPEPPIRAIYAVGKLQYAECTPHLIALLQSKNKYVRIESATSLGLLKRPESVDALGALATEDSNSNVRMNAVVAIGKIGSSIGLPYLESASNDSNEYVSRFAREAIELIAQNR